MAGRTDSLSVVEGPDRWDSQRLSIQVVVAGIHPVVELDSGTLVEEAGPEREGSLGAVDRPWYCCSVMINDIKLTVASY